MNGWQDTARRDETPVPALTGPLEITELPAPGGGTLGLVHCPGRRQVDGLGRHWRRDLADDVARIAAWRPRVVLTLLEAHEFAALGVQDLAHAFTAAGLVWHHLPIPDMGVPGADFARRLADAGVLETLRRGERVLLHCAAGLGRTGMLAAKLLVALGVPADEAISQVRARRPGAIETPAQTAYVSTGPRLG